jgi:hypothetical protein
LSRKRVMPNEKNEAVVVETDSLGRSRNITYHATFDQVCKMLATPQSKNDIITPGLSEFSDLGNMNKSYHV